MSIVNWPIPIINKLADTDYRPIIGAPLNNILLQHIIWLGKNVMSLQNTHSKLSLTSSLLYRTDAVHHAPGPFTFASAQATLECLHLLEFHDLDLTFGGLQNELISHADNQAATSINVLLVDEFEYMKFLNPECRPHMFLSPSGLGKQHDDLMAITWTCLCWSGYEVP